MVSIKYSRAAMRDLEQIGDYIVMEQKSPVSALATVRRIQDSIDRLEYAPHIGSPLSARYANVSDYRYLVCGSYLVFYREQSGLVYVDRILHGKRDYLSILFGNLANEESE